MRNLLIILCTLFFIVSCGKDNKPQSSDPEKQVESSNQPGQVESSNQPGQVESSEQSAQSSFSVVKQGEIMGLTVQGDVLTDDNGTPCTSSGSSTTCGDPALKERAKAALALAKRPRKYACSHKGKGLMVTYRPYEYIGVQPDSVLSCEVLGTSPGREITAYMSNRGMCERLASLYAAQCREVF